MNTSKLTKWQKLQLFLVITMGTISIVLLAVLIAMQTLNRCN